MESKEERKRKALEEYYRIEAPAWDEYLRKCREINEEDEKMETKQEMLEGLNIEIERLRRKIALNQAIEDFKKNWKGGE